MKVFILTLFVLGLTLTQSSPVAKKVEKRTAIESSKTDISSKLFNPKDETLKSDNFRPRSFKFDDLKTENIKSESKDENKSDKKDDVKDLKKDEKKDELRPEDDSETVEVDREKKSCKTIKTEPSPPTKICLEISSAPQTVEVCQDDPAPRPVIQEPQPAPQPPPETHIEFQPTFDVVPQPVFQVQPQIVCEQQPQVVYMPPPPQPSTICFETTPQHPMFPLQPTQISQLPAVSVQPQPQLPIIQVQPSMPQQPIIQVQPSMPQQPIFEVQPQPQFGNPQTLPEFHQYHKQLHKMHFQLPHQLHNIIHSRPSVYPSRPSYGVMPVGGLLNMQQTTCTCQTRPSNGGVTLPNGNQVSVNFEPTGPGTLVPNGQARTMGGLMFHSPGMNQPLMMNKQMMSSQLNGLVRPLDVSLGPMMTPGIRHIRGESGSPPQEHNLETEKKSHTTSSGKDEQTSTQISLNQSSSTPVLRISTPHQSQTIFSQNSLKSDKNSIDEDNMNMRNYDIQSQGMQPFLFGRSRQNLNDDNNLTINGRFDMEGL